MSKPTPELDDIDPNDEAMQLVDHCVERDYPWSEDDDEDTIPDDLDDDGEEGDR